MAVERANAFTMYYESFELAGKLDKAIALLEDDEHPIFGRLKNEMFYCHIWKDTTVEDFIQELDEYIHWYNEKRIKMSLGGMSPLNYRRSLGVVA